MSMNPEIKKQWLQDLRSGEFEQCRNKLYDGEAFCCLGVLENQRIRKFNLGWIPDDDDGVCVAHRPSDEYVIGSLSLATLQWTGLGSGNPNVAFNGVPTSLTYLNDKEKLSFAQIADLIEEQL